MNGVAGGVFGVAIALKKLPGVGVGRLVIVCCQSQPVKPQASSSSTRTVADPVCASKERTEKHGKIDDAVLTLTEALP